MSQRQDEALEMRDVRELLREKAALAVQESERLAELQQTMTVEESILLAQAQVGIVRQHVSGLPQGTERLRAMSGEFRGLMIRPDRAGRA